MSKKTGITLSFRGFDEMISNIQQAGGSVDRAVESCCKTAGQVIKKELKTQMQASNVASDLISRMPEPELEHEGNRYKVSVGYEKGAFDSDHPSDGYKAVFLNYGTPKRTKHGKVKARGFIQRAKKTSKPKLRKAQQDALETILKRVSK